MAHQTDKRLVWDRSDSTFALPKAPREKFLRGPVPWDWIETAASLPGKSLHIGLAVWRLAQTLKTSTIKLTNKEVAGLGVDRNAKTRALKKLHQAGLIRLEQRTGKHPIVTLVSSKP